MAIDTLAAKVLDTLLAEDTAFYGGMIALHNHAGLRQIARRGYTITEAMSGFKVYGNDYRYSDALHFTTEGFAVNVPRCIEPGSYCEDGRYENHYMRCRVHDHILIYKDGRAVKHVRQLFPRMTLQDVESGLEKALNGLLPKKG